MTNKQRNKWRRTTARDAINRAITYLGENEIEAASVALEFALEQMDGIHDGQS